MKNFAFSQENISKIASECLLPHLQQKIYEDLSENKFSVSIDTSTVCSQNLCVIQVKYLKQGEKENTLRKTKVIDRTLGVVAFKESSTSQTYLEILNNKLFVLPEIKENFIGIAHDFASSLTGIENGLITLLRKDHKKEFLDLKDPCHGLSLTIRNSLGHLPDILTNFITKIHSHFVSPQRKQQLIRIQEESGIESPLVLKKYVQTRWLNLGLSLERLLVLWDPLKSYMSENMSETKGF